MFSPHDWINVIQSLMRETIQRWRLGLALGVRHTHISGAALPLLALLCRSVIYGDFVHYYRPGLQERPKPHYTFISCTYVSACLKIKSGLVLQYLAILGLLHVRIPLGMLGQARPSHRQAWQQNCQ